MRAFLRQRLGISVGDYSDEVDDALPVELDGLERWGVGQRLLDGRARGREHRGLRRRRDRARDAAAGPARQPRDRQGAPDRRAHRGGREHRARRRRRAGVGRRQGRARRRAHAQRDGPRRLRRRAQNRHVLARQRTPPPRRLGALARADRRAPRAAVRGGHDRAGAVAARPTARRSRSPASRRSRTTRRTRERWRESSSRRSSTSTTAACASRSRSPACPRRPTPQAAFAGGDAEKAGRKAWESGWKLPQGGRRPRAPARAAAGSSASTS